MVSVKNVKRGFGLCESERAKPLRLTSLVFSTKHVASPRDIYHRTSIITLCPRSPSITISFQEGRLGALLEHLLINVLLNPRLLISIIRTMSRHTRQLMKRSWRNVSPGKDFKIYLKLVCTLFYFSVLLSYSAPSFAHFALWRFCLLKDIKADPHDIGTTWPMFS